MKSSLGIISTLTELSLHTLIMVLSLSLSQDYLFVWFGISIACHCLWLLLLIVRVLFPNRFLFKSPALINYDLGYKSDALKTFKLMNCMALPFVEVSEIIE